MKKADRYAPWIPAFAGMTIDGVFAASVIPAKAGIQGGSEFFNGLLTLTVFLSRLEITGWRP